MGWRELPLPVGSDRRVDGHICHAGSWCFYRLLHIHSIRTIFWGYLLIVLLVFVHLLVRLGSPHLLLRFSAHCILRMRQVGAGESSIGSRSLCRGWRRTCTNAVHYDH